MCVITPCLVLLYSCTQSLYHIKVIPPSTSVKNICTNLKSDIGMAVPKSNQTSVVGVITYIVHPYAYFSDCDAMLCIHVYWLVRLATWVCPLHISESWYLPDGEVSEEKEQEFWYGTCIVESKRRDVLCICDYPYYSCSATFWHCLPYFTLQFMQMFFYTCCHFF